MTAARNDAPFARYAQIFVKYSSPRSAMSLGVKCGDEWFQLIDTLCGRDADCRNEPQAVAVQVKKKLDGLRFYFRNASERQRGIIDMAQELLFRMCDQCGPPDTLIHASWIKTCCELHPNLNPATASTHANVCTQSTRGTNGQSEIVGWRWQ